MNANDLPSEPVVPPALPCHKTPERSVVKRKDSISTISSQPSMPSSSKAIPKVTSAENVASFYNDMLGVVEGGEEECEEDDEVVSISSEDAGSKKITSQYTSTYDMAMVRVLSNGSKVVSRMKTGPNGFAIATFEGSDSFKQVCSIPVKGRSPEQMLTVVKEAIQRLTSGEDKDAVKAWLKT